MFCIFGGRERYYIGKYGIKKEGLGGSTTIYFDVISRRPTV